MSGQAGWYPDPGGQRAMFRYWNGATWSSELSADPSAPAPGSQPPGLWPAGRQNPGNRNLGTAVGRQPPRYGSGGNQPTPYPVRQPRRNVGWWVLGAGLILVLIIAGAITLPGLLGFRESAADPGVPAVTPQNLCPPESSEMPTYPPPSSDGRVRAGNLSYPKLGSPWGPPQPDNRVPFGRGTQTQTVMVEENYDSSGSSWVASVLIAELAAGDGFFSPEQGSEIVVNCVVGSFYGEGTEVKRDDRVNDSRKIDGRDAWLVESNLSFDIPGLQTSSELLIVAIVKTTDTKSALYYASIPNTVPELEKPARDLIDQLQVDG